MSCRVANTSLLAGACVVSAYAGHGVLGGAVSSTGTHGPSPIYNDLSLPADAGKEYRWAITSPPASGTLTPYENGNYSYAPPGGTVNLTDTFTYRLWEDGADLGTAVATITVGSGSASGVLAGAVGADEAVAVGSLDGGGSTLSGAVAVDPAMPSGALGVTGPSSLDGAINADPAVAAGTLATAGPSSLDGAVSVDPVAAAGSLGSVGPSIMGGAATLDPVELGGALVGDVSQVLPSMDAGRRNIRPGRAAAQWLLPLDPDEVDNLSADFSAVFGPNDPLINAQVTCEARQGTDSAPIPLMFGAWQLHGHVVRQRIKGSLGLVGVTYLVRVRGISASGEVAVAAGLMKLARLS